MTEEQSESRASEPATVAAPADGPSVTASATAAASPPASPPAVTVASSSREQQQQQPPPPQLQPQPPATQDPTLVAERPEDNSDNDSALGDDNASSTASITSSIMAYRMENGRTYHSFKEQINYVLPNDAPEQDRLDLQHHLFQLTFEGRMYLCPAGRDRPIQRCLDAGTGTGVWAMDFADEHPNAEVIGIDLSPIQPNFVPPNLSFQIDDLEDEWTFDPGSLDFVFARMLTGSIGNWPRFFEQSLTTLSRGSWLEVQDIGFPVQCDDDTLPDDSYLNQWSDNMIKATEAMGRSARGPAWYKSQMLDAGYVNVHEIVYKWPMNRWPAHPHYKELGFWCHQDIAGGLSGISIALFTRGLGWSPEEVEVFMVKVREDMGNRNIHAWWPIHVVYGQKPS